jgi:guanylate kinase
MNGKIIVIVAPSGTGKTTLITKLKAAFPELLESVSYTTRPMRPGEADGSNYFYISREEFLKMREKNAFLEWAEVHTNFYGTSKEFVENQMREGKNLLFDLDVQGADSFRSYFKDQARVIFIAPPSVEELENRLRKRATENTGVINIRVNNAKKEILRAKDYDYNVVNDDFERAYKELKEIFAKILSGREEKH